MNQKIVFPTNERHGLLSKRSAHFGRAHFYTLVEINEEGKIEEVTVVQNEGHQESGCGGAVENIQKLGTDVLIVSGIGGSPLHGFIQKGIAVFVDNASQTVQQSIDAFLGNKIPLMLPEMSCSHH